jgi:hypothetical protein
MRAAGILVLLFAPFLVQAEPRPASYAEMQAVMQFYFDNYLPEFDSFRGGTRLFRDGSYVDKAGSVLFGQIHYQGRSKTEIENPVALVHGILQRVREQFLIPDDFQFTLVNHAPCLGLPFLGVASGSTGCRFELFIDGLPLQDASVEVWFTDRRTAGIDVVIPLLKPELVQAVRRKSITPDEVRALVQRHAYSHPNRKRHYWCGTYAPEPSFTKVVRSEPPYVVYETWVRTIRSAPLSFYTLSAETGEILGVFHDGEGGEPLPSPR